jgi:hypothetical protein
VIPCPDEFGAIPGGKTAKSPFMLPMKTGMFALALSDMSAGEKFIELLSEPGCKCALSIAGVLEPSGRLSMIGPGFRAVFVLGMDFDEHAVADP